MSSSRQDAKHEKILRQLLKEPANKRCPNCDSLVGGWPAQRAARSPAGGS